MKIIKIKPQGFCRGVAFAVNLVEKVLKDGTTKKPIYMLGNIVHNKNVVNSFAKKGVIVLEGRSRDEMLDDITAGTVIITAHGSSDNIKRKAREKGLNIIDATCRYVTKTHDLIKNKLSSGFTVFYYGKANHPETEGVLGLSPDIILITDKTDINKLKHNYKRPLLTNQTTMSFPDVYNIYEKLKERIPNLELNEEVCDATRRRQEAVLSYKNIIDLCIVVGDPLSNNTRKLKEIACGCGMNAIQIESAEQLKEYDLFSYKTIGITAGASTPDNIVNKVIQELESRYVL